MTITRKPRAPSTPPVEAILPETEIQALIGKGGSVARVEERTAADDPKPQLVQLRLERRLVERIDAVLATRQIKIPRHTWLLEAVHEKLAREEKPL